MQSLAATNDVCTLPVYRPVIGFDKQEIVEIAEKIDTYETSILPFEDCCTIFVAKHPVTKPNINVIRRSEENLAEKIDELFEAAVNTVETNCCKIVKNRYVPDRSRPEHIYIFLQTFRRISVYFFIKVVGDC